MLPVLPVLPVILPLLFIVLLSFFKNKSKWVPIISVAGTSALTIISLVIIQIVHQQGIMVLYVGNWQAPFGISLVIDLFSAIMLVVSSIVSLAVAIYASTGVATELRRFFYLLFFALVMGVNGAFSTGDIFNLYVWYELMLMASFALITLGGTKQQLEGGIKYLSMNLVSSLFFLAGIGFLYGQTGTLNMADLAQLLRVADESIQVEASAMLFFVAFSIKSALFPVFFWLPSSYHTPALPVTALFAGLLTKVGVYSMIRFYTLIFVNNIDFWQNLILIVAGFTMVVGVITAASQYGTKKILSFHIISQIGYMIMGLGIFTPLALAGAIYYMVHNMFAKTNAFLVSGIVNHLIGTYDLKKAGGVYKKYAWVGFVFLVSAFALAGVPPLSGFFGKVALIKAGLDADRLIIAMVALLVGFFTLFSMLKIWMEVYWKPGPENLEVVVMDNEKAKTPISMRLPVWGLALMSIILGLGTGYFMEIFLDAGRQLLNPMEYIRAVMP